MIRLGLLFRNDNEEEIERLQITYGEFVEDIIESALGEPVEYEIEKGVLKIEELREKREKLSNFRKEEEIKNIQSIIAYIIANLNVKKADIKNLGYDKLSECFSCYLIKKYNDELGKMYFNILTESDITEILDKIK